MLAARDPIADSYEACEKRLTEWGIACRRTSEALGLPRQSSMESMLKHVQAEDRKRKGVRRRSLTAVGKQPKTFKLPTVALEADVLTTDTAVARLPGWAKKVIMRTFLYGQPNRVAADQMRMREGEYSQRRRAAVEKVAMYLSERYISRNAAREG